MRQAILCTNLSIKINDFENQQIVIILIEAWTWNVIDSIQCSLFFCAADSISSLRACIWNSGCAPSWTSSNPFGLSWLLWGKGQWQQQQQCTSWLARGERAVHCKIIGHTAGCMETPNSTSLHSTEQWCGRSQFCVHAPASSEGPVGNLISAAASRSLLLCACKAQPKCPVHAKARAAIQQQHFSML